MRRLLLAAGAALALVAGVAPAASAAPAPIAESTCAAVHSSRWMAATGTTDPRGTLRVFAIQWKQDLARVATYDTFRTAVRCTIQDQVLPHLRAGEPALVVFDEDIGLMTLGIGARGATVRATGNTVVGHPLGSAAPAPAGALAAIGQLETAYAPQIAAYEALFPGTNPVKALFLAATDTFVRGFIQTFSQVASDYGLYVEANNNMASYRESTSATDIATFADPSVSPTSAFVATSPTVTNNAYIWGPTGKLLLRNEKVPLTDFEANDLFLDNGPSTGAAAVANLQPVTIAGWKVGVATSLPAFQFGDPSATPCADVTKTYVRCLDSLGTQVLLQPDANNGLWSGPGAATDWQPLEWMGSSYRAVSDPTLRIAYSINPMMTGNLFDIPFDGQSGIFSRAAAGTGHYVGDDETDPQDNAADAAYHGDVPHVLAIAPWVVPDAPRAQLRTAGDALAPGSGAATENGYVETALYADLVPASAAPAKATPKPPRTRNPHDPGRTDQSRPAAASGQGGTLAYTGLPAWPAPAALLALACALTLRRARRP